VYFAVRDGKKGGEIDGKFVTQKTMALISDFYIANRTEEGGGLCARVPRKFVNKNLRAKYKFKWLHGNQEFLDH